MNYKELSESALATSEEIAFDYRMLDGKIISVDERAVIYEQLPKLIARLSALTTLLIQG